MWVILFSVVKTIQKIPDHLGYQLEGLGVVFNFEDPEGRYPVAHTRIPGNGADFPPGKPIGREVLTHAHFAGTHGPGIDAHQVGVAQDGFGQGQLLDGEDVVAREGLAAELELKAWITSFGGAYELTRSDSSSLGLLFGAIRQLADQVDGLAGRLEAIEKGATK